MRYGLPRAKSGQRKCVVFDGRVGIRGHVVCIAHIEKGQSLRTPVLYRSGQGDGFLEILQCFLGRLELRVRESKIVKRDCLRPRIPDSTLGR